MPDDIDSLDTFTRAYIECALWSSIDYSSEQETPIDDNYSYEDIAPKTLKEMIADCRDFRAANADDLAASGLSDEQQGHDFWLNRNRHGAGFWDRGIGALGRKLSDAAHVYGSVDLYVGYDDQIHA